MYLVAEGGKMAVEVYQSTSPAGPWVLVTSSRYAQAITTDDIVKNKLTSSLGNVAHPGTLTNLGTGPAGGWISDQFKLSATHVPNNGLYYKFRVYKGVSNVVTYTIFGPSRFGLFIYKLCYPTDAKVNEINTDGTTNYGMEYGGSILNRPWAGGGRPVEGYVIRNV